MLTVAGHSLGAAIATLLALDLSVNSSLPVGLYTLASPRVGDLTFSHLFNHVVPNAYRIDNRFDVVPKTPPPLFYFHVGDETELLPCPTMKLELTCEHYLSSYLNMLATQSHQQAAYPIEPGCLKAAPAGS
jgi:triacylglycerol lipase